MHNLASTLASVASCGRRVDEYQVRPLRARTLLNGKLVYAAGASSADCAIRDLSDGGAKVTVSQRQFLPFELYLIVVKTCVAHKARIVWMDFPARGLQFMKTYSLSAAMPEDLTFLRKLWGDLYARGGWDTMLTDHSRGSMPNN